MKRDVKQKKADDLRNELVAARSVILSGFEGITVSQDFELRRKLEDAGAKYRVAKNTVIERAAHDTPIASVVETLRGTTSLAYTATDPVTLAKAITTYAKENPVLVFKTGVVEGRVISLEDLNAIAALPSRDELLSRAMFLVNSPAQRVASALAGVARNLACVIQQGIKEKKFQDTAGS